MKKPQENQRGMVAYPFCHQFRSDRIRGEGPGPQAGPRVVAGSVPTHPITLDLHLLPDGSASKNETFTGVDLIGLQGAILTGIEQDSDPFDLDFGSIRVSLGGNLPAINELQEEYRCEVKKIKEPALNKMREKLATEEGKAIYKKRASTVETVFGIIKEVLGFRGFMLRGLDKVTSEWELIGLSHNIKRLHTLKSTLAN